jgi:hypothetical protein
MLLNYSRMLFIFDKSSAKISKKEKALQIDVASTLSITRYR